MYVYIYIYICVGNTDSIHHLPEVIVETAAVPELRQRLLYTTPSGWWVVLV